MRSALSGASTTTQIEPRISPAGADGDRDPGLVRDAVDIDGFLLPVEGLEGAAFLQGAQFLGGHLAVEDGRDPVLVGLVLSAGEGQHPAAAVLHGDRAVQQSGRRVGQGEQVTGEGFGAVGLVGAAHRAQFVDGEQRPQQRGHLGPGRSGRQAEHGHAGAGGRLGHRSVHRHRGPDHHGRRAQPGRPVDQGGHRPGAVHTDAEHHRAGQPRRFVQGVLDQHPGDGAGRVRLPGQHFDQRRSEIVEDPAEHGPWLLRHLHKVVDRRSSATGTAAAPDSRPARGSRRSGMVGGSGSPGVTGRSIPSTRSPRPAARGSGRFRCRVRWARRDGRRAG